MTHYKTNLICLPTPIVPTGAHGSRYEGARGRFLKIRTKYFHFKICYPDIEFWIFPYLSFRFYRIFESKKEYQFDFMFMFLIVKLHAGFSFIINKKS